MAKSTRSKVKRSFRAKKRDEGVYAATEAARLQRLHSKLTAKIDDGDEELAEPVEGDTAQDDSTALDVMELDDSAKSSTTKPSRISTHGPRNSRREGVEKVKRHDACTEVDENEPPGTTSSAAEVWAPVTSAM
ncbi:hypothetical protein F4604DRAFT_1701038, partial [Suillus subluteus]